MRTTSRLIRTVLVAAGLLAISASAAQAMPTRQSTDATDSAAVTAANRTIVFHRTGFLLDNKLPVQGVTSVSVMQPAAGFVKRFGHPAPLHVTTTVAPDGTPRTCRLENRVLRALARAK